jgi:O-succinylbenzoate synthase
MPLATTLALANGDRPLGRIALNALLPDADPERALPLAAQGWSAFKWKSSGDPERDASDAIALRRALGPGARLRLDANASWDLAGAKAFADAARDAALDYVEQPLPPDQDPALAELVPLQLRVALDESIRNLDDLRRACQEAHAEVVVLKPQWLGGWPRLREAVTIARSGHRRRVVLSSSLDGAIGRAHSLHAACALGLDGEAHGLATGALLAEDLGQGPEPSAGWLALPTTPGLGVSNG